MIVIINGNYVIWYQILSRLVEMSFPLYNFTLSTDHGEEYEGPEVAEAEHHVPD